MGAWTRMPFKTRRSVLQQRVRLDRRESLCAGQERELDDERGADHLAAEPAHELARGPGRTAGPDQVVDHEHLLLGLDRVLVDLDRVGAVLEVVADLVRGGGQLAW